MLLGWRPAPPLPAQVISRTTVCQRDRQRDMHLFSARSIGQRSVSHGGGFDEHEYLQATMLDSAAEKAGQYLLVQIGIDILSWLVT